ncbi:hypothetical protein LCGC14_1735110, partial [marine sediment metagenome]
GPRLVSETPIRRIDGSPVLWRELRRPLLEEQVTRTVAIAIGAVVLGMMYLVTLATGSTGSGAAQAAFVLLYLVVGMAWTAVLAATTIAPEKEARSWPLLLTTTLADKDILWAKVLGVLRRTYKFWILLGAHLVLFSLLGLLHPIVLLHVVVLVAGVLALLIGMNIYFTEQ